MAVKTRIITSPSGARFSVSDQYADTFQALINDLETAGYIIDPSQSGGFNQRNIAGTNTPSLHSFGRAIDINWSRNARGSQGDIPADLARSLAKKHGLTWGGDWKNPDPMHFEFSGPVPMNQRSLVAYAGNKQPTDIPAQPTDATADTPTTPTGDIAGALDFNDPQLGSAVNEFGVALNKMMGQAPKVQAPQVDMVKAAPPRVDLSRVMAVLQQRKNRGNGSAGGGGYGLV